MIKTVDVGLMANHLSAHHAIIKRFEVYLSQAENQQIVSILKKQIAIMKNHVQVMNQLLDPPQTLVTMPPIPNTVGEQPIPNTIANFHMKEKDMAMDAHFTASAMAKENFNSAENMKNPQVKKMHSEMALQQSTIAEMYELMMQQMGWMNQPNATAQEQSAVIMPLETMDTMQNQSINQSPNQIN